MDLSYSNELVGMWYETLCICGLHHLIHKTNQEVHKGNDYERDLD